MMVELLARPTIRPNIIPNMTPNMGPQNLEDCSSLILVVSFLSFY